jgi:hypothetical protein
VSLCFASSESFLVPRDLALVAPCADHEGMLGGYRYVVELVIAFFPPRSLQSSEGTSDARNGNFLLPFALIVSPNRIAQRGWKEIRDDAKSSGSGRSNVSGAIAWQWIRVIDDKGLFCLETGGEQKLLPPPCSQHIQTDANVTVEETLAIERSFPRPLHPDKDHGLHRRTTNRAFRPPGGNDV